MERPRFAFKTPLTRLRKTDLRHFWGGYSIEFKLIEPEKAKQFADVLSDWQYQSLYVELSSKGYRKKEPDPSPRETSQILAKVFAALRQENVTRSDIADELCVDVEELNQLVFGLALTGIVGGASENRSAGRRGQLQVVRSN